MLGNNLAVFLFVLMGLILKIEIIMHIFCIDMRYRCLKLNFLLFVFKQQVIYS